MRNVFSFFVLVILAVNGFCSGVPNIHVEGLGDAVLRYNEALSEYRLSDASKGLRRFSANSVPVGEKLYDLNLLPRLGAKFDVGGVVPVRVDGYRRGYIVHGIFAPSRSIYKDGVEVSVTSFLDVWVESEDGWERIGPEYLVLGAVQPVRRHGILVGRHEMKSLLSQDGLPFSEELINVIK